MFGRLGTRRPGAKSSNFMLGNLDIFDTLTAILGTEKQLYTQNCSHHLPASPSPRSDFII